MEEIISYSENCFPKWIPDHAIDSFLSEVEDEVFKRCGEYKTSFSISLFDNDFNLLGRKIDKCYNVLFRLHNAFKIGTNIQMKPVWEKLNKVNSFRVSGLFLFLGGLISINYGMTSFDKKEKIINDHLKLINDFKNKINDEDAIYSSYNPNMLKKNEIHFLHGDITYNLFYHIEQFEKGLNKILNHYKNNKEVIERNYYLKSPISRKSNINNRDLIFYARKVKLYFLKYYKKPLNQEIATIINLVFQDNDFIADADYIAKITKKIDKEYKASIKMEDSPITYRFEPSF